MGEATPMLVPVKYLLTRLGTFLPARAVYDLNASINYLEVGRWMRSKRYDTRRRLSRREDLFDLVGKHVESRSPVSGIRRVSRRCHAVLVEAPAQSKQQTPRVRQLRRTAGAMAPSSSEGTLCHGWVSSAD